MPLIPFAFLFEFGDGACKYGETAFSLLLLLKCIYLARMCVFLSFSAEGSTSV